MFHPRPMKNKDLLIENHVRWQTLTIPTCFTLSERPSTHRQECSLRGQDRVKKTPRGFRRCSAWFSVIYIFLLFVTAAGALPPYMGPPTVCSADMPLGFELAPQRQNVHATNDSSQHFPP